MRDSLQEKIRLFLNTNKGKQLVQEYLSSGSSSSRKNSSVKNALESANMMKSILLEHLYYAGIYDEGISKFTPDDIIIVGPTIDDSGNMEIYLNFNKEALHRDSLDPIRFPGGVDNIILLFTHGWDANSQVFGEWRGERVGSRKHKEPDSFMQDAVDEFNSLGVGVAYLSTEYGGI